MRIRMWEAVAAAGRLAELEAAARAAVGAAADAGVTAEACTDGESRVVLLIRGPSTSGPGEPLDYDAGIPGELYARAHAWVFTGL